MTNSFLRPPHWALATEPAALRNTVARRRKLCVFILALSDILIGRINTGQLLGLEIPGAQRLLFVRSNRSLELHDVPASLDRIGRPHLVFRSRNRQVPRV